MFYSYARAAANTLSSRSRAAQAYTKVISHSPFAASFVVVVDAGTRRRRAYSSYVCERQADDDCDDDYDAPRRATPPLSGYMLSNNACASVRVCARTE